MFIIEMHILKVANKMEKLSSYSSVAVQDFVLARGLRDYNIDITTIVTVADDKHW